MSHTILIECDESGCVECFHERRGTSVSYARLQARGEGWVAVRGKPWRDLCPDHARESLSS